MVVVDAEVRRDLAQVALVDLRDSRVAVAVLDVFGRCLIVGGVVGVAETGSIAGIADTGAVAERLTVAHLPTLFGAVSEYGSAVDAGGEGRPRIGGLRHRLLTVAEVEHDVLVLRTVLIIRGHPLLELLTGLGDR